MRIQRSLSHTRWECKYHIVWIPKYRKKKLFWELRCELGSVLRELASHRECEILEGQIRVDHVHILISIPPKFAVSQVVGYMKGKSAIHIARNYVGKRRNLTGQHSWARGYYGVVQKQRRAFQEILLAKCASNCKVIFGRVLCIDGWHRRRRYSKVHSPPRRRRPTCWSIEPMELVAAEGGSQ